MDDDRTILAEKIKALRSNLTPEADRLFVEIEQMLIAYVLSVNDESQKLLVN